VALDHLSTVLRMLQAAGGSFHALADEAGVRPATVSRIAGGQRTGTPDTRARLESAVRAWLEGRVPGRRAGRPSSESLDTLWDDLDARSPSSAAMQEAWTRVEDEMRRFGQIPAEQRITAQQKRVNAAWRAYHNACRPRSNYIKGKESRTVQRRMRTAQHEGYLPGVIYRDDGEDSWTPPREQLQLQMIDRAEFDAWPARVVAPCSSRSSTPPRGDVALHTDPSPRLTELLEELRLYRLIILIIQAATTDPAVAQALNHLRAQATRLRRQRTRQHRGARADAPPPAGHAAARRRRAPRR
jgi:hypothetical protein